MPTLRRGGQSLVELALLIPLLFLLFFNVVNFGAFLHATITVANAARAAANYRILGPDTIGSPQPPDAAEVTTLVTADVRTLRNKAGVTVRICQRQPSDNATVTCDLGTPGAYSNPPPDTRPEASLYPMTWVGVVYNYQPVIPAFNFPALGIYLTIPPATLRRQVVMRGGI